MNKTYALIGAAVLVVGSVIALFATRDLGSSAHNGLRVAVSFYPLHYLASEIGGEKANVFNVTPAGAEPHDFEPSASDWVKMAESAVLFVNGGDIDVWSKNAGTQLADRTLVIDVASSLMTLESEEHHEDEYGEEGHEEVAHEGEEAHELDPHVWLSPQLMQRMAEKVRDGYVRADPENASYYESRTDALIARLTALDAEFSQELSQCVRKEFVVSHAAFGYLAQAYGLEQVPISGISPQEEPSAQDLAAVTSIVREKQIPVIFFETLVSPKLSETIARETGTRTMILNPLEGLTDDEMRGGKNYVTEMRQNVDNLKLALGCAQ